MPPSISVLVNVSYCLLIKGLPSLCFMLLGHGDLLLLFGCLWAGYLSWFVPFPSHTNFFGNQPIGGQDTLPLWVKLTISEIVPLRFLQLLRASLQVFASCEI